MKQVIISSYDSIKNPYYGGGGAKAIHQVARRLVPRFQVTVITGKYGDGRDEIIDGVIYHQIGTRYQPQFDQLIFQICLIYEILIRRFDLWLESLTPPFSASLLPLFSRRPVIGLVHMLAAADMQRKYKLPFKLIQNPGLRLYSRFIVPSSHLKTQIKSCHPDAEIEVISNGIDKISPSIGEEKNQLLFMGRIEMDQKGLDLLISAFNEFKSKTSAKTKLVIAGSGDPKETYTLNKLVSVSPYSRDIRLVGHVEGIIWQQLFSESLGVVVSSRFETSSLTALEALSFGRPVICFDIPGLSWLPQNTAVKIPGFSISGLASAMAMIITDKPARERMGKTSLQYAENFTWDNISEQYSRYLNRILSEYGR